MTLGFFSSSASAQTNETEPNDTKAQANVVTGMTDGSTITGNSISATTTGLDYYSITLASRAPGIYRYRLVLSSATVGHTGTLRGLTQVAGVPQAGTDSAPQTSSTATTPPRFNQFYSFGAGSQLFYRVTGAAATTSNYTATMESVQVTPTSIGTFTEGNITIDTTGQGHTTDTDMWVYDSNFNAIPGAGNDDHFGGATFGSTLTRNYAPGTYFLALTNFQFANNEGSPADDDFRTGAVFDFPGIAANSSTTTALNMTFLVTDSDGGPLQVATTKNGPYDINWFTFNVAAVPEPASLGLLALAAPALLIRRRR
jgi:hypothetical protein